MLKLFPLILTLAPLALAQLPAPNAAGVSMGHLHLNVKDLDAAKSFFVDQLGATPLKLANNRSWSVRKSLGSISRDTSSVRLVNRVPRTTPRSTST